MILQLPLVQLYRRVQDYHSDFILVQNYTFTLTTEITTQLRYSSVYSQNFGISILFLSRNTQVNRSIVPWKLIMSGKQHAREYAHASSVSINILEYCNQYSSFFNYACKTIYTRGKNVVRNFVQRNRKSSKDAFVRLFPNSQSLTRRTILRNFLKYQNHGDKPQYSE